MKKCFTAFAATLAAMSLFIVGCSDIGTESEKVSTENFPKGNSIAESYISMLNLQTSSLENGLNAISNYIDIDSSARSALSGEISLDELDDLLPQDLSQFKRIRDSSSRTATGEESEYITLEEELDEIAENFENQLKEMLPDPSDALSLDYVSGTNTGLLIGDDMEIPYNSIEGVMTVHVLNAIANGEDVEKSLAGISDYLDKNFNISENDSARGLWLKETTTWQNNVVYYKWGNISESHKQAVLNAMRTWESKTSNCIRFKEFASYRTNNFFVRLRLKGYVTISDDSDLEYPTNGRSTIGYLGGTQASLKLRPSISGETLKRTSVHELGHVLGLKHEHQRYDRDDYLIVNKSGSNYEKIPKTIKGFRIESKRIRIGFCRIRIYYPVWWSSTNSYVAGNFDFKSVMLYPDIPVKKDKIGLNGKNEYTILYSEPSCNDIEAIKEMYR